ncbi:MAG: hypothetical protein VKO64_02255 [Candidatus Sericytochromatia bacterium]|nr:hypothetical protein [Candidatus Sericytochromatia bacterium]
MNRSIKAGLSATLSLAMLAGCDAAALRNLAQTAATTPTAEQKPAAADFKSFAGTWYLIDGENTENFNPSKGTLQFTKDGNNFKGQGTFTLFGGGQKSLTKLTLTKDKPRTGDQAGISIDFSVNDTAIIGKIYDDFSASADNAVGELTGNFATAADGGTKLELTFTATKQFGGVESQPGTGGSIGDSTGGNGGSTGGGGATGPGGSIGVPEWFLGLAMAGDQRLALLPGTTYPDPSWQDMGLRLKVGSNGASLEVINATPNGPMSLGVGQFVNNTPSGGLLFKVFVEALASELTIEIQPPPGPAARPGAIVSDARANQVLFKAVLEAFGSNPGDPNQGGGDPSTNLPPVVAFGGDWIFRFEAGRDPFDGLTTGVAIMPMTDGGVMARVLQGSETTTVLATIGKVEGLRVERLGTGEVVLQGELNLDGGLSLPLQYVTRFEPNPMMPGQGRWILVSGSLGDATFVVEELQGGDQGGGGSMPGPLPAPVAFAGDWALYFSQARPDLGYEKLSLALKAAENGNIVGRLVGGNANDTELKFVGNIAGFRLYSEGNQPPRAEIKVDLGINRIALIDLQVLYVVDRNNPSKGRWELAGGTFMLDNSRFDVQASPFDGGSGGGGGGDIGGNFPLTMDDVTGRWDIVMPGDGFNPFGSSVFQMDLGFEGNGYVGKVLGTDSNGNSFPVGVIGNMRLASIPNGTQVEGEYYASGSAGPVKVTFSLFDNRGAAGERPWYLTSISVTDGNAIGQGSVSEAQQIQPPPPPPYVALPDSVLGDYTSTLQRGSNPFGVKLNFSLFSTTTGNADQPFAFGVNLYDPAAQGSDYIVADASFDLIEKLEDGSFTASGRLNRRKQGPGPEQMNIRVHFDANGFVGANLVDDGGNVTQFSLARPSNGGGGGGIEPPAATLPSQLEGRYDMRWFSGNPYDRDLQLSVADTSAGLMIELVDRDGQVAVMPMPRVTKLAEDTFTLEGTFKSVRSTDSVGELEASLTLSSNGLNGFFKLGDSVSDVQGDFASNYIEIPPQPPLARYELNVSGLGDGLYTVPFLSSDVEVSSEAGFLVVRNSGMYAATNELGERAATAHFLITSTRLTSNMTLFLRAPSTLPVVVFKTSAGNRMVMDQNAFRPLESSGDYVLNVKAPEGETLDYLEVRSEEPSVALLGFAYDAPVQP